MFLKVLFYMCFLCPLCSFETIQSKRKMFRLEFLSIDKCNIPQEKMDPTSPISSNVTMRKTNKETLVNVELNVTRRFGPLLISCRTYEVTENYTRLIYNLEKIPCTNTVIHQVLAFLKVRLDRQCFSRPGTFKHLNVSVNNFSFLLTKAVTQSGK
ncbi:uncharacterized protein LOC131849317 [Achroia grisella]|uniref:uncharacterized protein LOC131849317 n=1 Tax=Achroia grisella TaxID=688607 RepID=UPI0027D249AD|nr:uncharacterized protein LOC131849317 [Achroia grisella]